MGVKVDVNLLLVVKQIVIIVFLPMLLGYFTRQWFVKKYGQAEFKKTWAPRFPSLSTIGVLGIVFVALALKAKGIAANPAVLGSIFVPLLIIYSLNFGLGTLLGKALFERGDAIALVYGTVMRNLSIALAIAINAFGARGPTRLWSSRYPILSRCNRLPGMSNLQIKFSVRPKRRECRNKHMR